MSVVRRYIKHVAGLIWVRTKCMGVIGFRVGGFSVVSTLAEWKPSGTVACSCAQL